MKYTSPAGPYCTLTPLNHLSFDITTSGRCFDTNPLPFRSSVSLLIRCPCVLHRKIVFRYSAGNDSPRYTINPACECPPPAMLCTSPLRDLVQSPPPQCKWSAIVCTFSNKYGL